MLTASKNIYNKPNFRQKEREENKGFQHQKRNNIFDQSCEKNKCNKIKPINKNVVYSKLNFQPDP